MKFIVCLKGKVERAGVRGERRDGGRKEGVIEMEYGVRECNEKLKIRS